MWMNFTGLSRWVSTSTHDGVLSRPSLPEKIPKGCLKSSVSTTAPFVPSAPSQKYSVGNRDEDYEERAAIMEYDGGLSRSEAERQAVKNSWR